MAATLHGHGPLRVIVLDDYQNVALSNADWSVLYDKASIEVLNEAIDPDHLVSRLQKYDIICAMRERTKFPADVLEKLPDLKLLITTGMNNRGIDVTFAKERGIMVSGTSSQGNSTMEHIWAIILATVRYIALEDKNIKENNPQWQTVVPFGLSGKTLGLLGVGGLGSRTAQIAKVFGMRVLGWSPHLTAERAAQAGVEFASSKEELMKQSDVLSVHMVSAPSTRGIIGQAELALMKKTAFLINTSRGPLVDEAALIDALREESIAGAGLDVYDVEPLPLQHPLRGLKNVTLSPHNGYANDTSYQGFFKDTVDDILAYLEGNPVRLLV